LILALVLPLFGGELITGAPSRFLLIDTDAGSDDLIAVLYLLRAGATTGWKIRGITVSNGLAHPPQGAHNLLRLLQATGHTDIPVAVGRAAPLEGDGAFPSAWRARADALYGLDLPESPVKPLSVPASRFLVEQLRTSRSRVRVIALGPLTNLAEAIQADPTIVRKIERLVIMGGAVFVPGNVRDIPEAPGVAEWNFFVDPLAARVVFTSGVAISLVPLDASRHVPLDETFVQELNRRATTPEGKLVIRLLAAERDLLRRGEYFAWDPLAALLALKPDVGRTRRLALVVMRRPSVRGQTRVRHGRAATVSVYLTVDPTRFRREFLLAFEAGTSSCR
jgi:inosine-uridine nucleoside N-ribohydrolase